MLALLLFHCLNAWKLLTKTNAKKYFLLKQGAIRLRNARKKIADVSPVVARIRLFRPDAREITPEDLRQRFLKDERFFIGRESSFRKCLGRALDVNHCTWQPREIVNASFSYEESCGERQIKTISPKHIICPSLCVQDSPVRHAGLIRNTILSGPSTQLQVPAGLHLPDEQRSPDPQQRRLPELGMIPVLLRAAVPSVPCQRSSRLSAVPGGLLGAPVTHRTTASRDHGRQGPVPSVEPGGVWLQAQENGSIKGGVDS
ncbi:hypothetical protein PO909_031858 [Leuciscus waleckii]